MSAATLPNDVRFMHALTRLLMYTFALLLVWAVLLWLVRLPAFGLRGITVTGDVAYNNAVTVRANVAPRLSGNFFTLDLASARDVFETLPWVQHAVVQREFPNRLRVVLREQRPVAHWGDEQDARMVNADGEVFDAGASGDEHESLPRLRGPSAETSAQVLQMHRQLNQTFSVLQMSVDELSLSARGSWRAVLDGGAQVELGRGSDDEVLARTRRFVDTLTQVAGKHGRRAQMLESADLRHTDGYALRLRGVRTVGDNRTAASKP
ncbi:MAG: FtsQ-type POTRA domain-containing protein [Betaproteobacteria bacterium]|jgi:cell division protein FtsQ|nr:FtsQ-type POTRA domain-containing protein [Betaproteobacteria bacterium]NBS46326.1 FtsQ-type POTRA domain-containing protein [Betaproteobacteria bacterium]